MELQVVEQSDALSHVALRGRLDIKGVSESQMKFTVATSLRHKPTIVDLSGLEFIASLGMGMLVDTVKALKRSKAGLVLLSPQPMVREALVSAHLTGVCPIVETLDEAKAKLGLSQG